MMRKRPRSEWTSPLMLVTAPVAALWVTTPLGSAAKTGTSTGPDVKGDVGDIERIPSVNACGYDYTIALKPDGTLWSWGRNHFGQLGLRDTTDRYTPTQVGTDKNWAAIACGDYHTLALKSDGTLWAWGNNSFGQLGLRDTTDRHIPTQVGTDKNWAAIVCRGYFTAALKSDGTLWAWGRNDYGQLGLRDTTDRHTPTQVGGE